MKQADLRARWDALQDQSDAQRLFTLVVQHARAMNGPSFNTDNKCRYRHEDTACLIGGIIADEHYSLELEGAQAGHVAVGQALRATFGFQGAMPLKAYELYSLQRCHDLPARERYSSAEEFKAEMLSNLRWFAARNNLTMPD